MNTEQAACLFQFKGIYFKNGDWGGEVFLYAVQEVYVWLSSHIVQSSVQQFAAAACPPKNVLGGYCFYFMMCGGPRMFRNEERMCSYTKNKLAVIHATTFDYKVCSNVQKKFESLWAPKNRVKKQKSLFSKEGKLLRNCKAGLAQD